MPEVAISEAGLILVPLQLFNLLCEGALLALKGGQLTISDTVGLGGHPLVEGQALDNLLGGDLLDLQIIHLLPGVLGLPLQTLHLLHRHAHLAQLVEHLEVWEEGKHVIGGVSVGDKCQKSALISINAHVDRLGYLLDEGFLEGGRIAALAC